MPDDGNLFDQFDPGVTPSPDVLHDVIGRTAERYGLDPDLVASMVHQESGGRADAVSPQGAAGIAQLEPETAASLGVSNLFDWSENLDAGARYLKQGLDRYGGRPDLALAYYHGGPDVNQWGPKTAQYADSVMQAYRQRKAGEPPPQAQPNPFDQFGGAAPAQSNSFDQFDQPTAIATPLDRMWKSQADRRAVQQLPMAKTEAEAPVAGGDRALLAASDLNFAPLTPEQQARLAENTKLADETVPQAPGAAPPSPPAKTSVAQDLEQRAGAVGSAMKQAYEGSDLLTPMAQKWMDDHGIGWSSRAGSAVLGAFSAVWSGATETANQLGDAVGIPNLGDSIATTLMVAGMEPTVAHAPLGRGTKKSAELPSAESAPAPEAAPTEVPSPAAQTPEQVALAELEDTAEGKPPTAPEPTQAPAAEPTAAPIEVTGAAPATERMPATETQGLRPVYNEQGQWIGEERTDEPATEKGVPNVENAGQSGPGKSDEVPSGRAGAGAQAPVAEPATTPPNDFDQFDAAPAPRSATPFEAPPKEPERLSSFLKRAGGVQDDGGDIRSSLGGSKYRPGLINRNGLPLDEATLLAWQNGYFPEFGDTRPAINDLREALHDDLNGRPVYSHQDEGALAAYRDATERNTEIDRLAAQHGIDTLGKTRAQFFDELADRVSQDELGAEMESQDAASAAAEREFEQAARATVASDAKNARDLYGQSQARSLEDLEREHQQASPSSEALERQASGDEPGLPGAAAGIGEENSEPRGGGAGVGRGDQAESAATDLLGRPVAEPRPRAAPEPTIHNDARQDLIPGTEASAIQAQAARDAQGRGALQTEVPQKAADEGLFANPHVATEPSLFDIAKAVMADQRGGNRQTALQMETTRPQYEMLRDKKGLAKAAAEVRAGLAPTSMRGAKPMEFMLRRHNAEGAQAYDRAMHALDKVRAATDQLSKQAQIEFTDRMEHGVAQPTPELQAVADTLRGQIDMWAKKIQGLGKGYLANAIENYMGHIWGNYPEWAANLPTETPQSEMQAIATARNVRRQPLRGSGSFLKQRSFPTQLEGINAGLVPATFNPVDLQMIKLHEMQKFYHGTVLADQIKANKLATWVPATAEAERDAQLNGWQKLDDTIFKPRIMGANNEAGYGRLEPGNYWAPEPLARVFNNYMSQGWHGRSAIYDAMRASNNALNTLQLGLSGFHATFVTADTAISKVALGLQQITQGHPVKGAGNLLSGATIAPAVARTVWRGAQLRKAWLEPENATPEMRQVVDALKTGGGRISMPRFFQTSASGTFFHTIADLKNPQSAFYQAAQMFRDASGPWEKAVMTPLHVAARVLDTLQQPLMGALVPRAKLGVFADMAQNWLRDHPTATHEEVADAMTKFQDSVDNRLGQLNYDNLFWNKVAKDIAFVTTRSVGWNLGTVREIGGAFVDSADAIKGIANGRAPTLTTRMAYTIALPIVTAEIGAIMTYLATGSGPQSMLDYFYPPTGGQDQGGRAERRSIPGYMKDVIAFQMDPLQTALNKTAPMLETLQELAHNRDYYGGIIYDPERDKGPAQAYGDYLINQAAPFSLRSYNRLHGEGAPALDQALGFWGFQAAPKSITAPERGEAFQRKQDLKAYRAREREPGHLNVLNAPQ